MHLALLRLEAHARDHGLETAPQLLAAARCEIADALRGRGLDGEYAPTAVLVVDQASQSG